MSIQSSLIQEIATIADTPVVFPFEFKEVPEGKNPGKSITISPITVATCFRIRPFLAMIEDDDLAKILQGANDILTGGEGAPETATESAPESEEPKIEFETDAPGVDSLEGLIEEAAAPESESEPETETEPEKELSVEAEAAVLGVNVEGIRMIEKYGALLFEVVCMGIHNRKGDMPKWFKDVLRASCTWTDIYILLNAIFARMGTQSFLNSITAARAASPIRRKEIIAFQKNKKSWTPLALSDSSQP